SQVVLSFFFQAEDGIRDFHVTGVQTCALPIYTQPTDMRKSFNGLVVLVKNVLQENPLGGQCFVFINRRKTHIKLLYFDGSGYCRSEERRVGKERRSGGAAGGRRDKGSYRGRWR